MSRRLASLLLMLVLAVVCSASALAARPLCGRRATVRVRPAPIGAVSDADDRWTKLARPMVIRSRTVVHTDRDERRARRALGNAPTVVVAVAAAQPRRHCGDPPGRSASADLVD